MGMGWCAPTPLLNRLGGYCEEVAITALALGPGMRAGVKPYSVDATAAKRLWPLAQDLFGSPLTWQGDWPVRVTIPTFF
jgi:hypothetical protein